MEPHLPVLRIIFQVQRTYFDCVRAIMGDDHHIHPRQGPIMGILLHNDGLSQADLVRRMNVTAATVAVSISRLEKLDYVKRVRNELNQRANVLALTSEGRKKAQMIEDTMLKVRDRAIAGLSNEDLDKMAGYCDRMYQNLRELQEEGKVSTCTKCSNI
ncbi:MAG: MarR family transcriptional regulator [Clostridia bacterium]